MKELSLISIVSHDKSPLVYHKKYDNAPIGVFFYSNMYFISLNSSERIFCTHSFIQYFILCFGYMFQFVHIFIINIFLDHLLINHSFGEKKSGMSNRTSL